MIKGYQKLNNQPEMLIVTYHLTFRTPLESVFQHITFTGNLA